eukprot:13697198-Ditylum_brightwellii.AAC.1
MSSTGPNYARKLHLVTPWKILVFQNGVSLILIDKYESVAGTRASAHTLLRTCTCLQVST